MIQRIQSLYLLLAFVFVSLLLIFPLFSITAETQNTNASVVKLELGAYGLTYESEIRDQEGFGMQYQGFERFADNPRAGHFPVYGLFITLALLSAISILTYKNRKRQLMFTRINFVLHLLVLVAVWLVYYFGTSIIKRDIPESADVNIYFNLTIGFYLLAVSVPLIFLAIRGIKRDDDLIKSLDRLR